MKKTQHLYLTLVFALVCLTSYGQGPPITVASNIDGEVQYQSNLTQSDLHFYIYGDGYYDFQMSPLHGFPQSTSGYETFFYHVGNKVPIPPTLYDVGTGQITHDATSINSPLNMLPNVDPIQSWNITNYANTFIVLNFSNNFLNGPADGCVEFKYNPKQLEVDIQGILEYNDWVDNMEVFTKRIRWDFSDLEENEQRVVYIPVRALKNEGTQIRYEGRIRNGCSGPWISTVKTTRVNNFPHDPNFKTVTNVPNLSHSDPLEEKYSTGEQVLRYKIQFHNDGEGKAENVHVVDELMSSFDPSSVVLVDASHAVDLSVNFQTVEFQFNNINLAGFGQNVPYDETIGWVVFDVCVIDYINPGDCVDNSALIYFDNQDPIVCENQFCALISDPISYGNPCIEEFSDERSLKEHKNVDQWMVSPNPAENHIVIDGLNERKLTKIDIFDSFGQLIRSTEHISTNSVNIGIKALPKGIYYIQINSGNESETKKIIKI